MDIQVICHPEDISIEGNAIASGDDAYDKEVEDKIRAELEYNQWAWCTVEVKVTINDCHTSEFLGGCSYKDENDFITGGYYEDMVSECIERLHGIKG